MLRPKLLACTILSVSLIVPFAQAQAQSTPSSADAGRIEKTIKKSLPSVVKEAPVNIKGNAPFSAPAGSEKITFILNDVTLDGATVYTATDVQPLYADKVGKKISLADVYSIAANMTAKYRNDGYILTQVIVPPQTIEGGHVRLRVVEGTVNQIKVDGPGAQGSNADIINKYVSQLRGKGALRSSDLEKALMMINDLPGVTARSILSPSKTVAGTSDLTIFIERDSMDGVVQLDNYGSRYLGQFEILSAINFNSLLGLNERLSAQVAYAPSNQGVEPELAFGELSGNVPVGPYGTSVEGYIGKSYTDPGAGLDQFDVVGKSYFTGLKVHQPFIRTRELNLSSTLGLDRQSTETKSNVDTFKNDDLTSVRLGGHFDVVDTLLNAAITNVDLELSHGLSILGASEKGDSDLSRAAGNPEYTKVTADISRLERLSNQFSLMLSAKGQLASSSLLSSEEFGLGGASGIGRGYDPSELAGDDGVAGSVEIQWASPYSAPYLDSYSVYGFYDIGKIWNGDAITDNLKEQSLASTGIGVRASINPVTHAGFMVAVPLTRDVAAENDNDPRFYFNLSRDF